MGGPIYNAVMEKAAHLPLLQDYMSGAIDKAAFLKGLAKYKDQLAALGLSDWWIGLLARFPADHWNGARRMMEALYSSGLTQAPIVDEQAFLGFEQLVEKRFSHLPDRYTSIFPEEARIAHALSRAIQPENIFVAGSYYGYLAVWLIPGLAKEGHMVCSDVDPAVCELARRNMDAIDGSKRVEVICEDAEKLLKSRPDPIDLFVLDAYGGHDHPDAHYRGKAIYGPLLKAALPRLHDKSILLVHNAEKEAKDLIDFFNTIKSARLSLFLDTTDSMAVFQM